MITAILDFIFVLNVPLSTAARLTIEKQIETLASLYLREFELVMLPRGTATYRTTLYEDPTINLVCPFEVESDVLRTAGFSRGLVEQFEIGYDPDTSQFTLCDDISTLLDMFHHTDTLLFVELPHA